VANTKVKVNKVLVFIFEYRVVVEENMQPNLDEILEQMRANGSAVIGVYVDVEIENG